MENTFAIVELMGHNVIAGRISEESVAGVPMLRVDVPETEEQPAYTKFFAGQAIYGITPTDEATMRRAVNRLHVAPVAPYVVAPPLLAAHTTPADDDEPPEPPEWAEDDDDAEIDPPVIL